MRVRYYIDDKDAAKEFARLSTLGIKCILNGPVEYLITQTRDSFETIDPASPAKFYVLMSECDAAVANFKVERDET